MVSANVFRPMCFGQLVRILTVVGLVVSLSGASLADVPAKAKASTSKKPTAPVATTSATAPAASSTAPIAASSTIQKKSLGACNAAGACGGKACASSGSLQLQPTTTAAPCTRCCVTCGNSKYCGCAVEASCGFCCCGQCCTP